MFSTSPLFRPLVVADQAGQVPALSKMENELGKVIVKIAGVARTLLLDRSSNRNLVTHAIISASIMSILVLVYHPLLHVSGKTLSDDILGLNICRSLRSCMRCLWVVLHVTRVH